MTYYTKSELDAINEGGGADGDTTDWTARYADLDPNPMCVEEFKQMLGEDIHAALVAFQDGIRSLDADGHPHHHLRPEYSMSDPCQAFITALVEYVVAAYRRTDSPPNSLYRVLVDPSVEVGVEDAENRILGVTVGGTHAYTGDDIHFTGTIRV